MIILILVAVFSQGIITPADYTLPKNYEIHITEGHALVFTWEQTSQANYIYVSRKTIDDEWQDIAYFPVDGPGMRIITDTVPIMGATYHTHECFVIPDGNPWHTQCVEFAPEYLFIDPQPYKTFLPIW